MTNLEAYTQMLELIEEGTAILTSSEIHPDIPLIHEVGPGRRLDTHGPVEHIGFGLFKARVPDGYSETHVYFDGGGAMYRADTFSWCPFTGAVEATGYDREAVRTALLNKISYAAVEAVNERTGR